MALVPHKMLLDMLSHDHLGTSSEVELIPVIAAWLHAQAEAGVTVGEAAEMALWHTVSQELAQQLQVTPLGTVLLVLLLDKAPSNKYEVLLFFKFWEPYSYTYTYVGCSFLAPTMRLADAWPHMCALAALPRHSLLQSFLEHQHAAAELPAQATLADLRLNMDIWMADIICFSLVHQSSQLCDPLRVFLAETFDPDGPKPGGYGPLRFRDVKPVLGGPSEYSKERHHFWNSTASDAKLWNVHIELDDGKRVHSSRAELASFSGYFQTLFTSTESFAETEAAVVHVKELSGPAVCAIVEALYSHEITIDGSNAADVLQASDRLEIPVVREACAEALTGTWGSSGTLEALALLLRYNCLEAAKLLADLCSHNFYWVLAGPLAGAPGEQRKQLLGQLAVVPQEMLLDMLSNDLLGTSSEADLIPVIFAWLSAQAEAGVNVDDPAEMALWHTVSMIG
ncbi:hypothetical protein WJX72_002951 [[Myrmecia] bisecta]|uniref:BTB domain-containing protein n=1 Tax=[Myrmecia] bisecta TaxID=41462 RepID=A0AAW1PJL7_9CHLO